MSQTIILSRAYWFLKIWSSIPNTPVTGGMDKKWNKPKLGLVPKVSILKIAGD